MYLLEKRPGRVTLGRFNTRKYQSLYCTRPNVGLLPAQGSNEPRAVGRMRPKVASRPPSKAQPDTRSPGMPACPRVRRMRDPSGNPIILHKEEPLLSREKGERIDCPAVELNAKRIARTSGPFPLLGRGKVGQTYCKVRPIWTLKRTHVLMGARLVTD